jgi:hypothetical protein
MNKIIIDNRSDLNDADAVNMVLNVIKMGRISNEEKQYCYLSLIQVDGKKYQIASFLNKKSDRFIVNNHD